MLCVDDGVVFGWVYACSRCGEWIGVGGVLVLGACVGGPCVCILFEYYACTSQTHPVIFVLHLMDV